MWSKSKWAGLAWCRYISWCLQRCTGCTRNGTRTVTSWLMLLSRSVPFSCVCHDSSIYTVCISWLNDSWHYPGLRLLYEEMNESCDTYKGLIRMRMPPVVSWLMSSYRSVPLSCVCHDSFIYMIGLPSLDDSWLMTHESCPGLVCAFYIKTSMCYVTHTNESYEWRMDKSMSHATRTKESYGWHMNTPICHAIHTNESFEWHMDKSVSHATHE